MSEEILDLAEFMERVQDDKELLLELLEIFTEDYQEKRKLLGEAVTNKDLEQIKSIGHSLKGASGNISAKALRETCIALEIKGKEENLDGADELLNTLDKQYQELTQRMASIKEELSS